VKSTTVPILRYQDADKAIEWLCSTIGFEVFLNVPGKKVPGQSASGKATVEHARLILGDSMIMIATLGREGDFDGTFVSPLSLGGITQCASLFVEDPKVIYDRVVKSGVEIVEELAEFEFGGSTFCFKDIESHMWVITSHDPWKKLW
jgi:uncharacterized glyoxalase superfamily protein PhnB